MDAGLIARRYATVLRDYATDEGQMEAVYADSLLVREALEAQPAALAFLQSPLRKPSEKKALLRAAFGRATAQPTQRFLDFLVDKERVQHLPEIMRVLEALYRRDKGICTAQITTAVELPEAQKADIVALITDKLRKAQRPAAQVAASFRSDKRLIGGVVLALDGRQLDASLAAKLRELQRQLTA